MRIVIVLKLLKIIFLLFFITLLQHQTSYCWRLDDGNAKIYRNDSVIKAGLDTISLNFGSKTEEISWFTDTVAIGPDFDELKNTDFGNVVYVALYTADGVERDGNDVYSYEIKESQDLIPKIEGVKIFDKNNKELPFTKITKSFLYNKEINVNRDNYNNISCLSSTMSGTSLISESVQMFYPYNANNYYKLPDCTESNVFSLQMLEGKMLMCGYVLNGEAKK